MERSPYFVALQLGSYENVTDIGLQGQHAYVLSTLHRPLVVGGRRVSRCVADGLSHPRPAADMGGAARRLPRIHLDIDVDSGRRTDAPSGERLEVSDVLQSGITDHD